MININTDIRSPFLVVLGFKPQRGRGKGFYSSITEVDHRKFLSICLATPDHYYTETVFIIQSCISSVWLITSPIVKEGSLPLGYHPRHRPEAGRWGRLKVLH